jgi:hypothetical protein
VLCTLPLPNGIVLARSTPQAFAIVIATMKLQDFLSIGLFAAGAFAEELTPDKVEADIQQDKSVCPVHPKCLYVTAKPDISLM